MSVNNEFDEILKGKFDASAESFPFSEDKWARMEEVIIADEARKKRRKFLLIFMGGFIVATALILPASWFYFSNQKSEIPKRNINKIKLVETNKSGIKNNSEASEKFDVLEATTPTNENKKLASTESNMLPEKTKAPLVFNSFSSSENETKTKVSKRPVNNEELSGRIGSNNTLAQTEAIQKQEEKVVIAPATEIAAKQNANANPLFDSVIAPAQHNAETMPVPESPIVPDELANSQRDQSAAKGFHFGINAGASYNLGFQQAGTLDDGKSIAPFTGVYLTFSSKNSWSLGTGINYTFVNSLSFQKQVVQRSYDFGYTDKIYELTHKKINYVIVPFEVSKIVARKNKIGLGVQFHYLMSTSSELNTTVRNSLTTISTQSKKTSAYQDGLNRLDIQPTLSYERMLNTRFMLRLETAMGVIDVRKNNWTNNAVKELNKSIRFIVKYQIK